MNDKMYRLKIQEHLTRLKHLITKSLGEFEQVGVKFDENFEGEFLQITNDG